MKRVLESFDREFAERCAASLEEARVGFQASEEVENGLVRQVIAVNADDFQRAAKIVEGQSSVAPVSSGTGQGISRGSKRVIGLGTFAITAAVGIPLVLGMLIVLGTALVIFLGGGFRIYQ